MCVRVGVWALNSLYVYMQPMSVKIHITPHWSSEHPQSQHSAQPFLWHLVCLYVFVLWQGNGDGLSININSRISNGIWLRALTPGGHRGLEIEGGAGAEEPLRTRGPQAAAAGLQEAALHECGGGQQALELRFPEWKAGKGLQRWVGGAQLPGRAGILPQLHI